MFKYKGKEKIRIKQFLGKIRAIKSILTLQKLKTCILFWEIWAKPTRIMKKETKLKKLHSINLQQRAPLKKEFWKNRQNLSSLRF